MTRRSRSSCGKTLIGIGLMTVVFVVTFCGLVLAAEIPTATLTLAETPTRTPTARFISSASPPPVATTSATSKIQPTETGATAAPTVAPTVSICNASVNASVEGQVIALINAERVAQGLAAYSVDSRLTAAARVQGSDMACNHFTSHTGSDGSTVRDRVARQGYA
jgi:uncharacterized protein YkwD